MSMNVTKLYDYAAAREHVSGRCYTYLVRAFESRLVDHEFDVRFRVCMQPPERGTKRGQCTRSGT